MQLQLLSDLHLESEHFQPRPAPGADLLVLAGDIDSRWRALQRFASWPCPVVLVAGNHEFDGRDLDGAARALRSYARSLGMRLLECERMLIQAPSGEVVRLLGTARWSDFDAFGESGRPRALKAAGYFARVMKARRDGRIVDAEAIRLEALRCRAWLAEALREPSQGRWHKTVVITHFAPSLRSNDPRYGLNPATASFCNADDDLIPLADLWLHGHLHCRHDYVVAGADGRRTRVVCAARGLAGKGESEGHDPLRLVEV